MVPTSSALPGTPPEGIRNDVLWMTLVVAGVPANAMFVYVLSVMPSSWAALPTAETCRMPLEAMATVSPKSAIVQTDGESLWTTSALICRARLSVGVVCPQSRALHHLNSRLTQKSVGHFVRLFLIRAFCAHKRRWAADTLWLAHHVALLCELSTSRSDACVRGCIGGSCCCTAGCGCGCCTCEFRLAHKLCCVCCPSTAVPLCQPTTSCNVMSCHTHTFA
jgi:hypothetical protein